MKCQFEKHQGESIVGVCLAGCKDNWCCARCQHEMHESHIDNCKNFVQIIKILESYQQIILLKLEEEKQKFETIKHKIEQILKEVLCQAKLIRECIALIQNQHYKDPIVENMIKMLTKKTILTTKRKHPQTNELKDINEHLLKLCIDMRYLAQYLAEEGKNQEASTYLKFVLKFDKNNQNALQIKGYCLIKINKLEKATRIFDRLIQLNPNNFKPYLLKALTLRKRKLYTEALNTLYQANQINGNNNKIITDIAIILYKLNNTTEALEKLNLVIKADPKYEQAYFYKAKCLIKTNRFDEAKETYQQLLQRNPQCGLGYFTHGLMLFGQQNYQQALQNLIESVKQNPSSYNQALSQIKTQINQEK